tara:strand:- start:53 stop:817 length:765 start_codon:yes stop_codon:yes gene_type:complete
MGKKFVFIKAADNDAYMNLADNFRGCDHQGDTSVILYFDAVQGAASSGAYDKIELAVSSNKEQEVMEFIGAAIDGSGSKTMTVIADAVAGTYVNGNITGVTGITRGIVGSRREVEAITNGSAVTRTLTATESGKLFTVDMSTVDNNVTLTLPAASTSAGVWYDFCFLVNSDDDADFIIKTDGNATDIYGGLITLAANSTVDAFNGMSKITVDADVAQSAEGMNMHFVCDGVNWHLSGHLATAIATVHLVESATV